MDAKPVEALVKAAIRLAILRHDMGNEDGEYTNEQAAEIADDTWDALQGIGTCDAGPAKELTDVLEW
jgi:hypothetical protein